jgi:hypothetical protein
MRVQIIDIPMDTRQANTTVNEVLASIKGEIKDQQVLDDRRIIVFFEEDTTTEDESTTGPTGSGETMTEEEEVEF